MLVFIFRPPSTPRPDIHTRWRGPMRTHTHGTHGWTTRVYSLKRSSFFRFPHAIMFLINTRRYLLQNKRSCMSGGHSSQTCLHDSLFCSSSSTTSFYSVRRFVQFGRMSQRLWVVRALKNAVFKSTLCGPGVSRSKHKQFQRTQSVPNLTQNWTWGDQHRYCSRNFCGPINFRTTTRMNIFNGHYRAASGT